MCIRDSYNLINDSVLEGAESQIRTAFQHEALNLALLQFFTEQVKTAANQKPPRSLLNALPPVKNHTKQFAPTWQTRPVRQLRFVFELSLIHISEPTRLLSKSYA